MTHILKTTPNSNTFIHTHLNYNPNQPKKTSQTKPRKQTTLNSKDYKRSLRRAFQRAKLLSFFNPDLNHFITFTYKTNNHTPQQTLSDIKQLIKTQKTHYHTTTLPKTPHTTPQPPKTTKNTNTTATTAEKFAHIHQNKAQAFKYIYVLEHQKRGSIHVHMICNNWLEYIENEYGYLEVKHWPKGYTNIRTIEDFDNEFRTYKYLFKYMTKAERIGKSFIHTSRTFDKIENVDYDDYYNTLNEENALFAEDIKFTFPDGYQANIIKKYYRIRKIEDS